MQHKLSNVLLTLDSHMKNNADVYYREDGEYTNFFTYFGTCSIAKWKKYTGIDDYFLHIDVKSDCVLHFVTEEGPLGEPQNVSGTSDLQIPKTEATLVSFMINCKVDDINEAFYFVETEKVNDVSIALCTTTFKKEEYIVPNIELVKKNVLGSGDPIAKNFHMFVVDNGQTLDAKALTGDGVTVVPNSNVGGAGGFARGMMETLASEEKFTHVLLMDDDVRVSPESFKRTFNLLSLANERYKGAFINGAMLTMEHPNLQFEDVSYVAKEAGYDKVKPDLFINQEKSIVKNEKINVEVNNAYGAWWFSCIPVAAIKDKGLPLPFFVRCDDVEFGIRNTPTYMTMNGICVWHEAFGGRFRPSVDCYQYIRNFSVMMAVHDCCSRDVFMVRMRRTIRLYLRLMMYDAVDLMLDGLEDYLKGPSFLESCSGEQLMKDNGKRNEKLISRAEIEKELGVTLDFKPKQVAVFDEDFDFDNPRIPSVLEAKAHDAYILGTRVLRSFWYDRHVLPDSMLKDRPEVIYYKGLTCLGGHTCFSKTLIAMDEGGKNGVIRRMDKKRWNALRTREKELMERYKAENDRVMQEYREAMPKMTSWDFWNNYLGTNLKEKN